MGCFLLLESIAISALIQLIKVMLKHINFILFALLAIVFTIAVSIYFINPYNIDSKNIRPRLFGLDIYKIPSKSMQPLLSPGDYILVSNTAYHSKIPTKNDVIIFFRSILTEPNKKTLFIKRILAIQGDSIKIENGTVLVNDKITTEPYVLSKNKKRRYSQQMPIIQVPQGKIFVMGDNRDNSNDSRIFGVISTKAVIGKATSILYRNDGRTGSEIK